MSNLTSKTHFDAVLALGIYQSGEPVADYRRSRTDGFMDLVVERLEHLDGIDGQPSGQVFSLAHYFSQNGDLCADPEMTVIVNSQQGTVEPRSFQQAIPPIYQEVYADEGQCRSGLKASLNEFLTLWLGNLIEQGHGQDWDHNSNTRAACA